MQTNPMQMAWNEYRDQVRLFGTKPTNFGNLLKQCHRRFRAERQQAETNAAFAAADAAKFNREMRGYRAAPKAIRAEIDAAREQLAFRKTGMLSGDHGKDIAALEARIDALLFPAEIIPSTQTEAA